MNDRPLQSCDAQARRVRLVLWTLVLLGLALRVGAVIVLKAWEHPSAMEHRSIALFMLNGEGFSFHDWGLTQTTSVQSPPYPLLLAGLFYLFGPESSAAYITAMMLNAVLGAGAVALTYAATRVLGGSARVGLIAAGLVAVWPTQVYAVTVAQAVAAITLAVLVVVWLYYRSLDTGRLWPWIIFSVVGCVGALTEPVLLPPMALTGLVVLVWPGKLDLRGRLRNAAVLLLAAIVILGPWTLRNYLVHDTFMPVKSTFWVNIWKANNDHATGTDRPAITDEQLERMHGRSIFEMEELARDPRFDSARQYGLLSEAQVDELNGKTEVEREAIFKRYASTWIGENRAGYFRLCGVRLVKTLWVEWDNPKARNLLYMVVRSLWLLLTVVGVVVALRHRWRWGYPAIIVGGFLVLYTFTITAARFILPLEPLGLIFGALAIAAVLRLRKEQEHEQVPAADPANPRCVER